MGLIRFLAPLACLAVLLSEVAAEAQSLAQLRRRARQIEGEISQIRGLQFKWSIDVAVQSPSDFQAYAERQIDLQYSALDWEYYDLVIRKLGLYNGAFILDRSLVLTFLQAGALAYYDPDADRFYILKQNLPENVLDAVLAHELCHGLQDQHFDLNRYLPAQSRFFKFRRTARAAGGRGGRGHVRRDHLGPEQPQWADAGTRAVTEHDR